MTISLDGIGVWDGDLGVERKIKGGKIRRKILKVGHGDGQQNARVYDKREIVEGEVKGEGGKTSLEVSKKARRGKRGRAGDEMRRGDEGESGNGEGHLGLGREKKSVF